MKSQTDRQIYRRRRSRYWKRDKGAPSVTFYRELAMFPGFCGICSTSYSVGEPIFHCPKTTTTRRMRVHERCYLQLIRRFAPSNKPSPAEGELRRDRETVGTPRDTPIPSPRS